MSTYYENITETVCYLNPSDHRRKLFKYRQRSKLGKPLNRKQMLRMIYGEKP